MSEPKRALFKQWGVVRRWQPMGYGSVCPNMWVMATRPYVLFEEQGHTMQELEDFYGPKNKVEVGSV